jgi:four helix bundle protein
MLIVNEVYKACRFFPKEEIFGLRSQMTRAAVSIPSNIAEGSAKQSRKEYKYYLETSLGSAFELETHLLIVKDQGWSPKEIVDNLLTHVGDLQRMISSFIKKLGLEA